VAAQKEEKLSRQNPICWIHANGEATGLPSDSFDLVSLAYVVNLYQIYNLLYMDFKYIITVTTKLINALQHLYFLRETSILLLPNNPVIYEVVRTNRMLENNLSYA
jgi:hypothetical protein